MKDDQACVSRFGVDLDFRNTVWALMLGTRGKTLRFRHPDPASLRRALRFLPS